MTTKELSHQTLEQFVARYNADPDHPRKPVVEPILPDEIRLPFQVMAGMTGSWIMGVRRVVDGANEIIDNQKTQS